MRTRYFLLNKMNKGSNNSGMNKSTNQMFYLLFPKPQ